MFVGDRIPWRNILRFHQQRLLMLALAAGTAVALERHLGVSLPSLPTPFTVVGGALAILLAFRNGAAYDRWWEGRKLWGAFVNSARSLARQLQTYVGDPADRGVLTELVLAHAHALRCALRGEPAEPELVRLLGETRGHALAARRGIPTAVSIECGVALQAIHARGGVTKEGLDRLDATLSELANAQGGLERIGGTPLPAPYRFFTPMFTRAYVFALPFGLVEGYKWITVLVCLSVGFVFLVLAAIGELLESPFRKSPNGLPLDAITRSLEVQLRSALGDTDLPPDWPRGPDDVLT